MDTENFYQNCGSLANTCLIKRLFDEQENIVFLANKDGIKECNTRLLSFFGVNSLDELDASVLLDSILYLDNTNFTFRDYISDRDRWVGKNKLGVRAKLLNRVTGEERIFLVHSSKLDDDVLFCLADTTECTLHITQTAMFNSILKERLEQELKKKEEIEKEKRLQDELIMQQSKMAAVGEMVSAILHQWKQPLNALSIMVQFLSEETDESGNLGADALSGFQKEALKLIEHMNKTSNLFKNFFSPSKERAKFFLKEAVEETLEILSALIKTESISVFVDVKNDFWIDGFRSEFMHVLLNLISNARDAIKEKGVRNGRVVVEIDANNKRGTISVRDNGGGIPASLLPDRLFEPYITTKGEGGTGIGLYMSRKIIEGMSGKLYAQNVDDGAEFVIRFDIA